MSIEVLEQRLTAVEARLKQMEQEKEQTKTSDDFDSDVPWWERIRGRFKDDPDYDEAMRLGREWRDAENAKGYEDDEC